MYGAVGLSLAEMAARYTTAGGQYHWTSLLAPESMKIGLLCSHDLVGLPIDRVSSRIPVVL